MNRLVYRMTYQTQCGKTNIASETGETFEEAWNKATNIIFS